MESTLQQLPFPAGPQPLSFPVDPQPLFFFVIFPIL